MLLREIRACRHCAAELPCGPRPVLQVGAGARVAIIGQAPGSRVHESGIPWDDASGEHLREWLDVSVQGFRDPERFAIIPMGFCYPGKGASGDRPPRPECAPLWHARLFARLGELRLTLLVGQYAHAAYLGARRERTLQATVARFLDYLPHYFVLPHPSWRSRLFRQKNPWFDAELLPELRQRIARALGS